MSDLERLVQAAKDAAYGDSNDDEIEALQLALSEALIRLGRADLDALEGREPDDDD